MAQRLITIPDDMNERLKQEENASGLIQNLLSKYYQIGRVFTVEEIEKEEEFLKSNIELEYKKIDMDLKKQLLVLEEKKAFLLLNKAYKEQEGKNKQDELKQNIKSNILDLFEIPEGTVEGYIDDLVEEFSANKHLYKNLFAFMESKGYKDKWLNESKENG